MAEKMTEEDKLIIRKFVPEMGPAKVVRYYLPHLSYYQVRSWCRRHGVQPADPITARSYQLNSKPTKRTFTQGVEWLARFPTPDKLIRD